MLLTVMQEVWNPCDRGGGFTATKCVTDAGTTAVPAAGTVGVTDLPSTLASVAASRIAS